MYFKYFNNKIFKKINKKINMKNILFVLFFSYIIAFPNLRRNNSTEVKDKRQQQIDKLYECLNELSTPSFKTIINENKGQKFTNILRDHRVSLTKKDKNAIRECRKQILVDTKSDTNYDINIHSKVNLKRNKNIKNKYL